MCAVKSAGLTSPADFQIWHNAQVPTQLHSWANPYSVYGASGHAIHWETIKSEFFILFVPFYASSISIVRGYDKWLIFLHAEVVFNLLHELRKWLTSMTTYSLFGDAAETI